MVADIQTDLHNYLCNNLDTEVRADVTAAVDHLNLHSAMLMDSEWDESNQDTLTATMLTTMDIDNDWRSSDKTDYPNPPGMKCNDLTAKRLNIDKEASADVFVSN